MVEHKSPSRVKKGEFFIRRHGGWFRPGAHGYTDDIAQAGTFSAEDARSYMQAEGVTAVPVKSMRGEIWRQVGEAIARAAHLSALHQRL